MFHILDINNIFFGFINKQFNGWGIVLSISIIATLLIAFIFVIVEGNKEMIVRNEDRFGKTYPWRSTIIGITIFIVSIPLVVILALYIFGYI